jgi:hypothetical protein
MTAWADKGIDHTDAIVNRDAHDNSPQD